MTAPVEVLTEQLAEAARAELAQGTAWYVPTGESIAAALVPTVLAWAEADRRRAVAEALRAAADSVYVTRDSLREWADAIEAIEAAPAAEESLRVRVIKATHAAACNCGDEDPTWSTYWQRIADAAIAAMRGVS